MKRCASCKAFIADDASFCPKCGAKQSPARGYSPMAGYSEKKTVGNILDSEPTGSTSKGIGDKTIKEIYNDAVGLFKGKVKNSEVLANVSKSINEKTVREIYDDAVGSVKDKVQNSEANVNSGALQKAIYVGIVLVAVSVFMPMIKIIGLIEFSLMDYGKPIGFFCLLLCGLSFVSASQKKYAFPIIAGHSMLIFLIIVYANYSSEMQKNPFGAMASAAINAGTGIYLLVIGLLIVIGASLLCSLIESSGTITIAGFSGEYVKYILKPVRFFFIPLPGFVWIIAITILIFCVASLSDPFDDMKRNMKNYNRRLFGK